MRTKNFSDLPAKARQIALFIVLLGLLFYSPAPGADAGFPTPRGAVNDFAGIIDSASVQTMENVAREVLEKTGTSIVVAVVDTIGDNASDDYANRLYQAWGIGVKGKDRGVLVFLALKERKVRIETGYGVEGILPDGLTGEILEKYVLADLRAGRYGQGLTNGVAALAAVIAKDAQVVLTGAPLPAPASPRNVKTSQGINLSALLLIIIVLALLIGTRPGRELLPYLIIMLMSSGGRGGGSGGFGGGFGGGGGGGFGGGLSGGGGSSRDF